MLFDFVKGGKTMLVQYNTDEVKTANIAPYPLKNSRDNGRKCSSSVSSNHPVLNYPNKITSTDFEGWTRTRIVLSNDDKAFTLFCRP
jgi:hypothetical protein